MTSHDAALERLATGRRSAQELIVLCGPPGSGTTDLALTLSAELPPQKTDPSVQLAVASEQDFQALTNEADDSRGALLAALAMADRIILALPKNALSLERGVPPLSPELARQIESVFLRARHLRRQGEMLASIMQSRAPLVLNRSTRARGFAPRTLVAVNEAGGGDGAAKARLARRLRDELGPSIAVEAVAVADGFLPQEIANWIGGSMPDRDGRRLPCSIGLIDIQ